MRYRNIDLLKAVAMLFVVSLHAGTWHANLLSGGAPTCVQFAMRILAEGVPIFVAVNGFLLLGKQEFDLRRHLAKTVHLFLLLMFWSVFFVVIKSLIWNSRLSIEMLFQNIFANPIIDNEYIGCLWFLQSFVALYLFVPIIKYVYDANRRLFEYCYWISLLLWCTTLVVGYITNPLGEILGINSIDAIPGWMKGFFPASATAFVLFFMTGGMIRLHGDVLERHRSLFVALGFAAWVAAFLYAFMMSHLSGNNYSASFNYSSPFMFIMLFGWFAITGSYQGRNKAVDRIVTSIGKSTLGIYLLHTLVIAIAGEYVSVTTLGFPLRVLFLLAVFVISWLLTLLFKMIPGVRRLV